MFNGLGTKGWDWVKLSDFPMKACKYTLTIAFREDGALLDKISITNDRYLPEEPAKDIDSAK